MKKILTLVLLASFGVASEGENYDIIERTLNFALFVAILYYLIADKVKAFFVGRTQGIIDEHEKVQNRLKETKLAKQEAEKRLEEAKKHAADILATSKKENAIFNDKIVAQMESDIKALEHQYVALQNFEQRKVTSEIVDKVMRDVLSNENMPLDNELMTHIILKKVA
ncbi:MAG: hypothetical protein KU37_11290 [Sulfuricurvum sp. PC08-66]|nr:MAG: hypothetical protein KU37_11290 [Sulfuricurvum sp. PC08-66]